MATQIVVPPVDFRGDPPSLSRRSSIAAILVLCALIYGSAEVATRFALGRVSRIEKRIDNEYAAAIALRTGSGGRPTVLFSGNSLLKDALIVPDVTAHLHNEYDVQRLVIEGTGFIDWYYGLRRLFSEGARPDCIVLCLNASQLTSQLSRGDYFANRQMLASDVLEVARELEMSPTGTTSLLFGHFSNFFGRRAEIRKAFLSALLPSIDKLSPYLIQRSVAHLPPSAESTAAERLGRLQRLSASYGATFALMYPPLPAHDDDSARMVKAAESAGVPVIDAGTVLPPKYFVDGFHLGQDGAVMYTALMIPILKARLDDILPAGVHAGGMRSKTAPLAD